MKESKLLNYMGLSHRINSKNQPQFVNLILNTYDKYKVKYRWDEDCVIKEIIDICEYETEIFKENELLEKENLELKKQLENIVRESE